MLFGTTPNASAVSSRNAPAFAGLAGSVRSPLVSRVADRARASRPSKRGLLIAGFVALWTFAPSEAYAQNSVSAQMTVSMNIVDGCSINGSQNATTSLDFGTILNAEAQTQPIIASTDLTIACNISSIDGAILIDGGQSSFGGVRRMITLPTRQFVEYRLYADAAGTEELAIDQKSSTFNLDAGTPTVRTIYGRVLPDAMTGKPFGRYVDSINIQVIF